MIEAQERLKNLQSAKAKNGSPTPPKQSLDAKLKRETLNDAKAQEALDKLKAIEEFRSKAQPEPDQSQERRGDPKRLLSAMVCYNKT